MNYRWTPTEFDILETLTCRVPLLSIRQIGAIWWPENSSPENVFRELARLLATGLCPHTVINAHPPLPLSVPLAAWPNSREPVDCSHVAQRIQQRWDRPATPTEVIWASPRAANLFGSTARELPGLLHRDHDLLLAEVYVLYRRERSQLACQWVGEAIFPKAGLRVKDPDAFLCGDDGRPFRVIESAGRYGRAQVAAFHEHCLEQELPYELW